MFIEGDPREVSIYWRRKYFEWIYMSPIDVMLEKTGYFLGAGHSIRKLTTEEHDEMLKNYSLSSTERRRRYKELVKPYSPWVVERGILKIIDYLTKLRIAVAKPRLRRGLYRFKKDSWNWKKVNEDSAE